MALGVGEVVCWMPPVRLLSVSRRFCLVVTVTPGGAEYAPSTAPGSSPTVNEKPPWLEKQEKPRTTSRVEAVQDQAVKTKVEQSQDKNFPELFEEIRRANEKSAREREDIYRDCHDNGGRDIDW